ncbi:MAG TPA: hypothetical protein VMF89_33125 [Polyangiales bacterium]|nr:hypothetical protein [Polyangiales bacterium]
MPREAAAGSLRRIRACIGVMVFVSAGYFFGGAADNQNSRLFAIYAFVEPNTPDTGSFRIDRFRNAKGEPLTVDWAKHEGHYYSNKAPGSIWLGSLVYAPLVYIERALGVAYDAPAFVLANAYVIHLGVAALPLALGAMAMFSLALGMGTTARHAVWVALASTLGTLWFPYSTQLWGHTTAAALSAIGLVMLRQQKPMRVAAAGTLLGFAVCTDYLVGVTACALTAWLLRARPRMFLSFAGGALPCVISLMAYHSACFGSPFTTASQMSNPTMLRNDHALGLFSGMSLVVLWELTLGITRGLFTHCPVLLLAPVGYISALRRAPRDSWLWIHALSVGAYFVANASFAGWHGGLSVGSRYLICAIPQLALGLALLQWTPRLRWTAGVLSALSMLNMLAIAAVNPLAPPQPNPLYGHTYRLLFSGQVNPWTFAVRRLDLHPAWPLLEPFAMWNWGELLGLEGLTSLVPWLCMLALVAVILRRELRVEPARDVYVACAI